MAVLLLHITIWILGGLAVGMVFQRWSRRVDVHARALMLFGGVIGVTSILSPLVLLAPRGPLFWLRRDLEFWLIWGGVAALVVVVAWRLNTLLTERQRVQQLRAQAWVQGLGEDTSLTQELENARRRLENKLREQSGQKGTKLRWSSAQLPFTIGVRRPEVFAPLWTAYEGEGIYMAPLLAHEREHIRLGHTWWAGPTRWVATILPQFRRLSTAIRLALEVDADRHVVASEVEQHRDPSRYIHALEAVVGPAEGSGLEVGLGHDRSNLALRVKQSLTAGRVAWRYPALAALILAIQFGCHWTLGAPHPQELLNLATLRIQPNYNLNAVPAGLRLHAMPGKGGEFRDGLVLDTRGMKDLHTIEMNLVRSINADSERWVGFKGKVHIEIVERPKGGEGGPIIAGATGEELLKFDSYALDHGVHLVNDGTQWVLGGVTAVTDLDWKMVTHSGDYEVAVGRNHEPGRKFATDLERLYWWLLVPVGWKVEVTGATLAPNLDKPRPSDEVIRARINYFNSVRVRDLTPVVATNWANSRLYDISP